MSQWYLYILECEDGALYTGITQDLQQRFGRHLTGQGGHYTSYNRPTKILYHETLENESLAKAREAQIKRWSNAKKRALIKRDSERLRQLSVSHD